MLVRWRAIDNEMCNGLGTEISPRRKRWVAERVHDANIRNMPITKH